MSKIYRRPMFRGGGKVSSYGNGIATGLAKGGRVGLYAGGPPGSGVLFDPAATGSFKSPPTNRQVNRSLFGGFSNPIKSGTAIVENAMNNAKTNTSNIKSGIKNIKTNIGKMDFSEKGIGQALKNVPGYLDKGVSLVKGGIKRFPAATLFGAGAYATRDLPIDELIYEQEGYSDMEGKFRKLLDPTYTGKITNILKQGYNDEGELNARIALEEEKLKPTPDQQKIEELLEELRLSKIKKEPSSPEYKETVLDRKSRLKKTAKEYQEILGDGIKKDSIFDAMVAGGTALMEGEGVASAIRGANKALDPIQNIITASNKLAVEEDIAVRKALAVAKGKRTATGELLDFYKSVKGADGKRAFSDLEISEKLSKGDSPSTKLIALKTGLGTGKGFQQYVREEYKGSGVKFFNTELIKDVDFENLDDGVYYQPPTGSGKASKYNDKFITIKDKEVIQIQQRNR